MATTGHESEHVSVAGLKGALQQLKTDLLPSVPHYVTSPSGTAGSTASGSYNRTQWTGTAAGISALATGVMVLYKIPVAGVNKGVTLNINSLGEHPVVLNVNTNISTNYAVGSILPLVYDADQKASVYVSNTNTEYTGCWKIANHDSNTTYTNQKLGNGYGTCDTAADTAAKVASLTDYMLVINGFVSVKFTYAVPANATLNINSKGAKKIFYKGAKIVADIIKAGDIATFVYDGTQYQLVSIDTQVIGPASSTDAHVAAFDGTTGKKIKDSGYTIAKSVPSDAKFTDNNTTYKLTIGTTTKGDSTNGVDLGTLKSETAASGGTTLSLVTTGEKNTWNGKATKVSGSSLNNHVPALDSNGDLKDSGLTTTDIVAGTLYPVNIDTLTPSSTFRKNTIIGINGVIYRATADTSNMPCTMSVQDGAFVTHTINGKTAFVVTDSTPNTGWELFTDAGIEYWVEAINAGITTINSTLATKMNSALKGSANGVAELDSNGRVPSSQLPSYVDDVLEYNNRAAFPETGETGKIYIAKDTNLAYRWAGSDYAEISPSLALGETSSTAYRGDRGKAAFDHTTDFSLHVTQSQKTEWSGKQDAISDLATIRSNASTGATHAGTAHAPSDANKFDIAWNSSGKKLTKTVNGTTTDVVTANTIVSNATGAAAPYAGKYEVEEVNSGRGYIFAVGTSSIGIGNKYYFKACRPDYNVVPEIDMATGEVTVKGLKIGSNAAITLATQITVGNNSYTVSQLLQAVANIMAKTLVVNE